MPTMPTMPTAPRLSPALAARIRAALADGRLRGTAGPPRIDGERSTPVPARNRRGAKLGQRATSATPPGERPRTGKSAIVERLVADIAAAGLPAPVWAGSPGGEFRPIPGRRFKLDLAWPSIRLGWEVDGGGWVGGRHNRGGGMLTDSEKASLLAGLGWRVGRSMGTRVKGRGPLAHAQPGTLDWIRAAIERCTNESPGAASLPPGGSSSDIEPAGTRDSRN